jgi:hypothetical protein
VRVCVGACVFVYVCMYVCVYDCMYVFMYVRTYVFLLVCKYVGSMLCNLRPSLERSANIGCCDHRNACVGFLYRILTLVSSRLFSRNFV